MRRGIGTTAIVAVTLGISSVAALASGKLAQLMGAPVEAKDMLSGRRLIDDVKSGSSFRTAFQAGNEITQTGTEMIWTSTETIPAGGQTPAEPHLGGAGTLSSDCVSSAIGGAPGLAQISGDLVIADQDVTIPVDCNVHLLPGSSLTLLRARLLSQNLFINDVGPGGQNRVRILDSVLGGGSHSGFLIHLSDAEDEIEVSSSIVDYGLSTWIRVIGAGPDPSPGGRLEVRDSVIRSSGSDTEGVMLVSGGVGVFHRVQVDVPDDVPGFLYARDCDAQEITGAPEGCGPTAYRFQPPSPETPTP